ncbi:hypothetical protein NHX12_014746 [Muraenolepis orangiensis]|uniref:Secreted protein n=1 Tax=Muraenolepis orangiensis TaxID=630683 RepID=A0A9Q0D951_9TELE|nr:hypothetical protein NHX12_014746 [Muraenolepis orangiensis]
MGVILFWILILEIGAERETHEAKKESPASVGTVASTGTALICVAVFEDATMGDDEEILRDRDCNPYRFCNFLQIVR